jgi:copper chaperone CopZ
MSAILTPTRPTTQPPEENPMSTIQPIPDRPVTDRHHAGLVRQRFVVDGMTCSHCEHAIAGEVGALAGVTAVSADAATGIVIVDADHELDPTEVAAAIGEAGYEVVR